MQILFFNENVVAAVLKRFREDSGDTILNSERRKLSMMSPEFSPYSSARFYCTGKPDGITIADPAYYEFGKDNLQRQNSYKGFLTKFDAEEEKIFESFENPIGSQEFMRKLLKINGRYIPRRKGGVPKAKQSLRH